MDQSLHSLQCRLSRPLALLLQLGQPGQLDRLLDQQLFTVRARRAVLFVPPFASRLLLRTAPAWDAVGGTLFHRFCGVVVAEAEKEVAAPLLTTETAQVRRTVAVGETAR